MTGLGCNFELDRTRFMPRLHPPVQITASYRDAIFPDFSGIPDFHKSKSSMINL